MPKLVATVTQGSNDAFAETSIVTGLSNIANQAWVIDQIQFERNFGLNANSANVELVLSRASKAAIPNITDRDVLLKVRELFLITTSGMSIQDLTKTYAPPTELLIVEETIYFQIDTNATSASNTAYVSIEVHAKRITEQQRLSILASRIGS